MTTAAIWRIWSDGVKTIGLEQHGFHRVLFNTSFNTEVAHAREDEWSWKLRKEEDDGVHNLHSKRGRSAVVSIRSPGLWKVLLSFDSGLRSQRARAAHHLTRRGTPSKTENPEKS